MDTEPNRTETEARCAVPGSARRRPHRTAVAPSCCLALAALVVLAGCGGPATATAQASTATVERATISTDVIAAGTLTAAASRNLGFPSGGLLSSVRVHVGDTIRSGEILATVDSFTLKQLLAQQQANLSSQKAALSKLEHSPVVRGARNTLAQARTIRSATKSQIAATGRADAVAISRAKATRDSAQSALSTCTANCSSLQAAVLTAETAVATAQQKQKVDAAAGTVSNAGAQQGVVTAQNAESSAASDRPYTIAQQAAVVSSAASLVAIAEHNLSQATLKAPFDGVVTAINGDVGEYLTASTGTTAQVPGSDAAVPGTTVLAGTSAMTRSGGTQFMVVSRTGELTAVVPFQELDAASIVAGQSAQLTFDAIPDVKATGTVRSIAPSGTALSGTMSYYVTIRLSNTDARLKEGMTVHAAVATRQKKQVLSVPNSAVDNENGKSVVTVLDAAGIQQTMAFTPGLVGAERTEVVSGLTEGDHVVVPTINH